MTSPVNLPASGSSQSLHAAGSQAASGNKKRSAPTETGGRLSPSYSAEAIQAAPSLAGIHIDQVSERPRKMQRRGGMSSVAQPNESHLQPSQSASDRNADEAADLLANTNIKDKDTETKKS